LPCETSVPQAITAKPDDAGAELPEEAMRFHADLPLPLRH